ncbi:MAG TPA: ABC transporter substrate-binding protein [Rectinemataceae bacterium]|nr:ABC transporter substrate-binding protein [Rectinemataceae bacterium]
MSKRNSPSILAALALVALGPLSGAAAAPVALRFAALPIVDMVPLYVAEKEGLFAKRGLAVEFIPVGAAPERDQLLASGRADGAVDEIQAVINFNRDRPRMKVLRWALRPAPGFPHFFILAAKGSGIVGASGLRGVEIGVSQGTIIEYVTERLLEAAGIRDEDIKTLNVPKMPDRMALLASGRLKAAVMPDPLATMARSQGALVALDDSAHPEYGSSVISFSTAYIAAQPETLRGFLAAVDEASALVNADPASYASILVERRIVPPSLVSTFKMPPFPRAGVPSKAEFEDALAWLKAKGLIDKDVAWSDSVDGSFLPE